MVFNGQSNPYIHSTTVLCDMLTERLRTKVVYSQIKDEAI